MRAIYTKVQPSRFQVESFNETTTCNLIRPGSREEFFARLEIKIRKNKMLVLVRRAGEEITLSCKDSGQIIKVKLSSIVDDHTACIGISAPSNIKIDRSEVLKARKGIPSFIKHSKTKNKVDKNVL